MLERSFTRSKRMWEPWNSEAVCDVPARWSSEFLMLSHLLEPRSVITAHLAATDGHLTLSGTVWCRGSSRVSVLKPWSDAATPTLSEVIPILHSVQVLLEKALDKSEVHTIMFATNQVKSLKTRFPDYSIKKFHVHSCNTCVKMILFKDAWFETGSENYVKVPLNNEIEKDSLEILDPQDEAVT